MGVKVRFFRRAWWIFVDHHGKRRAKKIGDRETALRIAKELRERLGRADLHLPMIDAERVTFARYSETWLEQARVNLKASTVRFYEGHLEQHIVPALGAREVTDLRRADCRDLVTACRARNSR
jgi:integrase